MKHGLFPLLTSTNHHIASLRDRRYNCVAWAVCETTRWWQPVDDGYWPPNIPRIDELASYLSLFQHRGFVPCANVDFESGFEKVAIYATRLGTFKHVARQCSNGEWTSKLGVCEDIVHDTPHVLEAGSYGYVTHILKRRIPTSGQGLLSAVLYHFTRLFHRIVGRS